MHLGMSGSFRITRDSKRRTPADETRGQLHDHVVFTLSNGVTVTFNDPRRFGVMDVLADGPDSHQAFAAMGPEPLEASFGADTLARALAGKRVALKVALLDQRVVAGLGNIYASEALHLAGLSPLRRSSTLTTAAGRPTRGAVRLAAAIKTVLRDAIARKSTRIVLAVSVSDREGAPAQPGLPRNGHRSQAGRSTFCPACQR